MLLEDLNVNRNGLSDHHADHDQKPKTILNLITCESSLSKEWQKRKKMRSGSLASEEVQHNI